VALVSIWHAAAPTWRALNAGHREFAAYSDAERRHAPAVQAGFGGELFDWLRSYVRDDDRVYYQVPRRPYGTLDLHDTFASLGRWYLAPAVEVTDPAAATVVVSYEADPARLGLRYWFQQQFGPGIYVSRIAP
jgi:hypothetical protein